MELKGGGAENPPEGSHDAIGPSRAVPEDRSEMLKLKFPCGIALFLTSAAHGSSFPCVCADLPCSRTRSRAVHYHPGKSERS